MSSPTPYIEANLILAQQSGDTDAVSVGIEQLLPGERAQLAEACDRLASALRARDGVTREWL
jgi:hypothetical protein